MAQVQPTSWRRAACFHRLARPAARHRLALGYLDLRRSLWDRWAHRSRDCARREIPGAGTRLGSIAVGKLGDLVVLNTDPLENIRARADIRYVVKAGVL